MSIQSRPRLYIVYGNHGDSPHQLEDYFEYFSQVCKRLNYDVYYSRNPVPGFHNILIEFFDANFVKLVETASQTPGTRFIVVATEFVTGATFNLFEETETSDDQSGVKKKSPSRLRLFFSLLTPFLVPKTLRAFLIDSFPKAYEKVKSLYNAHIALPNRSPYDIKSFWKRRYTHFQKILKYCDKVWCVSPHQIDGYRASFSEASVELLPMVSWSPEVVNPLQGLLEKDIDFLFTGSITDYRKAIITKLETAGFNVVVGTATWPAQIRENHIARAKVCLHIKQEHRWKYPSIMRYHYLLCSGAVVLAEESYENCMQEAYLSLATYDTFVSQATKILAPGDFVIRGQSACENYFKDSEAGREQIYKMFAEFINNDGAHTHALESPVGTN